MDATEKQAVVPPASAADTERDQPSSAETQGETKPGSQREKFAGDDRLVMLCDGVFAIATTLLVLDIRLASGIPNEAAFNSALLDLLTNSGVFYLITFAVIADLWVTHRRLMRSIRYQDARFTWLTFVFLVFVAFFPVTSSVLESYSYPGAVLLYTLTFSGCGLSQVCLWLYASWHHRLIAADMPREESLAFALTLALKPVYFGLSLLLLLFPVSPKVVFGSWLVLPALTFAFHCVSRTEVSSALGRFLSHALEKR